MKTPVITVKKVSSFNGHDGIGVNADIYIDGVYVGHFFDSAHGGEPEFNTAYDGGDATVRDKANAKLKELEEYAASLPEVDLNADKSFGNEPLMHKKSDIDLMDDAINKVLTERDDKKKEKEMLKGILYGNPKVGNYRIVSWKGLDLAQVAARPEGLLTIQTQVNRIKKEMKSWEVFLNADILTKLGVKL